MPSTLGITSSHYTPQTFSIVSNKTLMYEGDTVTYNVSTTNFPDYSLLYVSNNGTTTNADLDFSFPATITHTGGTATFTVSALKDSISESTETIIAQLRTGSATGPIVATAPTVTVIDALALPLYITAETGIVDSLGNYPVTVSGTASTTTIDKKVGNASMSFPGNATGYISLSDVNLRQWSNQPAYTLQCWVKLFSYGSPYNYSELIKHTNLTGQLSWSFGPLNNGILRLQYWDGGGNQYWDSTATVPTLTWTHIGFTKNGNLLTTYINGSPQASRSIPGGVEAGTYPLVVGHSVNCLIDEFRIIPSVAQIVYP
jgi:hypothetical protein